MPGPSNFQDQVVQDDRQQIGLLFKMGSACAGGKYIEYRGFLSNHLSQVFDFTFIVPTLRRMFLGPRGPLIEPLSVPSTRNNFSWVHRWAETVPSGLRDPSNRIFSESPWCQLYKFGRKYKYKTNTKPETNKGKTYDTYDVIYFWKGNDKRSLNTQNMQNMKSMQNMQDMQNI